MIIAVILLGLVIGMLTGFAGAGGAIITVPALVYLIGLPLDAAISTSLVMGSVSPIAALAPRIKKRLVNWPVVLFVVIAGIPAAFGGTAAGKLLPQSVLLLAFAALMVAAGVQMLRPRPSQSSAERPNFWVLRALVIGALVGFLTGLFGVGGGFITIPALVLALDIPIGVAVGTSLAVALINTLAGLIAHAGASHPNWAVAIAFTAPSMIGAFLTARVAHKISPKLLQRSFAILILVIAVMTVIQVILNW
ncbi:sulfite exporter TauE/SafE family protein [Microbacterium panaciterrae]|uniref:Probable membrane transporter protein n=1 Tax=Microbacterium panaciterrae TaxID=985759 RepID=A0ABP8P9V0_9MICO